MITPNDYFDAIYLINLASRPDRLLKSLWAFTRQRVGFTRIDAIEGRLLPALPTIAPGPSSIITSLVIGQTANAPPSSLNPPTSPTSPTSPDTHSLHVPGAHIPLKVPVFSRPLFPGERGYSLTWLQILKQAQQAGHRRILICDDDIIFHRQFAARWSSLLSILPSDWYLLYLGASHWQRFPHIITQQSLEEETFQSFFRPWHTAGSFAVAVDVLLFPVLIELLQGGRLVVDSQALIAIQNAVPEHCFVAYPNLFIADLADSDIDQERNGLSPKDQRSVATRKRWHLPAYYWPSSYPRLELPLGTSHSGDHHWLFSWAHNGVTGPDGPDSKEIGIHIHGTDELTVTLLVGATGESQKYTWWQNPGLVAALNGWLSAQMLASGWPPFLSDDTKLVAVPAISNLTLLSSDNNTVTCPPHVSRKHRKDKKRRKKKHRRKHH